MKKSIVELQPTVDGAKNEKDFAKDNEKINYGWKIPFPGFGILCTIISGVFFSLNGLFAKLMTVDPIQVGVSRCCGQFLLLLPILQYYQKEIDVTGPEGKRIYLWIRGLMGSSAMIFLYLSIGKLSLGNAVTITFLSTVMVPIIARVWLKESLTLMDAVFALLSLFGVVLISQPSFLFATDDDVEGQSTIGIIYAVMSALCASCTFVTIRKLGKQTHYILNVFYYSFTGAFTTTVLLMIMGKFQYVCSSELFYMFALGLFGVAGQVFQTVALQCERASTVTVIRTVQIITVYLMQILILNDLPSLLSILGAGLIFSSSVGIGIRKVINERRRRLNK